MIFRSFLINIIFYGWFFHCVNVLCVLILVFIRTLIFQDEDSPPKKVKVKVIN